MSRTINLAARVHAFHQLGDILEALGSGSHVHGNYAGPAFEALEMAVDKASASNPWFTPDFIRTAFRGMASSLRDISVNGLQDSYPTISGPERKQRKVLVVMPGNFPAAGFHDMVCVLLSGHKLMARPSRDDAILLPRIWELLLAIEPGFGNQVQFLDEPASGFQAVIATGSNNTGRYFEHYFGRHPHIIRGSRNSAAIIRGDESIAELKGLADDICLYFGMGCRSVSKLYVPAGYSFDGLFGILREKYEWMANHNKLRNNYDYRKSIYLIGSERFLDTGFMLFREDSSPASTLAVVHYEVYHNDNHLLSRLEQEKDILQCVVCNTELMPGTVEPGMAQGPGFFDFADNVDTLRFLQAL